MVHAIHALVSDFMLLRAACLALPYQQTIASALYVQFWHQYNAKCKDSTQSQVSQSIDRKPDNHDTIYV